MKNPDKEEIMISVIIPVFNVQEYISSCIESVLNQSFQNFEIVVVNDGSTDLSLSILEHYAEDIRIRIITQVNQGLSSARNTGLKEASGKYILYLDGDDMLEKTALDSIVSVMEQIDPDLVLFDGKSFSNQEDLIKKSVNNTDYYLRKHDYPGLYSGPELMKEMNNNNDYRQNVNMQAAKRNFLIENNLFFYPGIIHEDNLYTFMAMLKAKKIIYLRKQFYLRRLRSNSIMSNKKTFRNVYGYFISHYEGKRFLSNLQLRKDEQTAANQVLQRQLDMARTIYSNLDENEKQKYKLISDELIASFINQIKDYDDKHHNLISTIKIRIKQLFKKKGDFNQP